MLSEIILSVVLILVSTVWIGIGLFDLGMWIPGVSADSGFMPVLFGTLTLVCAVLLLIQSAKKYAARDKSQDRKGTFPPDKEKLLAFVKTYAPVPFTIFTILCLQYLGLVPAIFLMVLGWMKLMNHFPWGKSVLIAAIVTAAIYGIFDMWLQIPFPGLI